MNQDPDPNSDGSGGPDAEVAARTTTEWFEVLYHELRRMARGELFRQRALTLGPTTLLHEAWLQLASRDLRFATQADLVRYTARVMRSIVIDHFREKASLKRGGDLDFVAYETMADLRELGGDRTLSLDLALQDLSTIDPPLAELVELKFFAGLTIAEIAALRHVSERTVQRDWEKARTLLFSSLQR
jgi:RNA polymerase sigma factor (TIGR02999 family)